jgi:hypothetical protein
MWLQPLAPSLQCKTCRLTVRWVQLDAAAAGNAVSNGLVVFIYGGNEYVYVESNSGNTYNSADFVVKLTGTPIAAATAIAGLGFDAV